MKMNWIKAAHHFSQEGEAYVIVTLIGVAGSTPRDSGTKMVISFDKTFDSIGGGHLEHKAIKFAKQLLTEAKPCQHLEHFQLGIHLDQCCGGSANVLFECFPSTKVNIMVFGAGHVAEALIPILAALPCQIRWVDTREGQFGTLGDNLDNVKVILSQCPEDEVAKMPQGSYFIVLTHKHQLDFDISLQIIRREDYAYFGLIGSKGKWKRFQQRLLQRDVTLEQLSRVNCPIGLDNVSGKIPMEVAVSISAEIIEHYQKALTTNKNTAFQEPSSIEKQRKQKANLHQGVHLKVIKQVLNKH
ncbi:MAG: xanthine dehydrogenase accessory factor [Enterobacterales bacterium]|jgi:xanthine dehydrogenase accessory factor